MKIVVSRELLGRIVGVVLIALFVGLTAYLGVAWICWSLNPGLWDATARGAVLFIAGILMALRSVKVAPSEE